MSVLWFDGLLAQTEDAGVYFLPEADVDELLEAAAVNTFPCLRVNLRGCHGREDLMLRLAGVLALPPHRLEAWSELPRAMSESSPAGTAGMVIVAVNGEAASGDELKDAVTAAKGGDKPIVLLVNSFGHISEVRLNYHDGLRYPHLERIPGSPDRLSLINAPRK